MQRRHPLQASGAVGVGAAQTPTSIFMVQMGGQSRGTVPDAGAHGPSGGAELCRIGGNRTGWEVGGRLQWLHAAVSAQVTAYAILPGRGYEQWVTILGADYAAFLVQPPPIRSPTLSCRG
jgi:hypothetical protein